jgi:glycerol-3-phosphate acyltransferase PlsY
MVPGHLSIALLVIGIVIFITHRANVLRLLRKQEPTISFSNKV